MPRMLRIVFLTRRTGQIRLSSDKLLLVDLADEIKLFVQTLLCFFVHLYSLSPSRLTLLFLLSYHIFASLLLLSKKFLLDFPYRENEPVIFIPAHTLCLFFFQNGGTMRASRCLNINFRAAIRTLLRSRCRLFFLFPCQCAQTLCKPIDHLK